MEIIPKTMTTTAHSRQMKWKVLSSFGIFGGLFGTFSPFWYVAPRKIWQSWNATRARKHLRKVPDLCLSNVVCTTYIIGSKNTQFAIRYFDWKWLGYNLGDFLQTRRVTLKRHLWAPVTEPQVQRRPVCLKFSSTFLCINNPVKNLMIPMYVSKPNVENRLWSFMYKQFDQDPILRLWNLQLQRQSCSRLERFSKLDENIFYFKTRQAIRGAL
jgi:hypothetical protein